MQKLKGISRFNEPNAIMGEFDYYEFLAMHRWEVNSDNSITCDFCDNIILPSGNISCINCAKENYEDLTTLSCIGCDKRSKENVKIYKLGSNGICEECCKKSFTELKQIKDDGCLTANEQYNIWLSEIQNNIRGTLIKKFWRVSDEVASLPLERDNRKLLILQTVFPALRATNLLIIKTVINNSHYYDDTSRKEAIVEFFRGTGNYLVNASIDDALAKDDTDDKKCEFLDKTEPLDDIYRYKMFQKSSVMEFEKATMNEIYSQHNNIRKLLEIPIEISDADKISTILGSLIHPELALITNLVKETLGQYKVTRNDILKFYGHVLQLTNADNMAYQYICDDSFEGFSKPKHGKNTNRIKALLRKILSKIFPM